MLPGLASFQTHQPQDATIHPGLGLPTSISNQNNASQSCPQVNLIKRLTPKTHPSFELLFLLEVICPVLNILIQSGNRDKMFVSGKTFCEASGRGFINL